MSRRPDLRTRLLSRLRPTATDEGFSLVEVMVAMLIFAIVAVASLGFITTSLTATALGRTETVAKNLNQERLEGMRNLPYFAHANVSTVPDLLDIYYMSSSMAATSTSTDGYVPEGGARDVVRGDPATGAFYRRVFTSVPGYDGYTQRVTAQFMLDGNAVLPAPVFDSQSTGTAGLPPSSTIGVRVTTLWAAPGGAEKRFTVYSQITEAAPKPPLVTLQGRLTALRFNGILPQARELVVEAGTLGMDGSLTTTTVSSAVAQAASAAIAGGSRVDGAKGSVSAPPTGATTVADLANQTLSDGTVVATFRKTQVHNLTASTDGGQPRVAGADPLARLRSVVRAPDNSPYFTATHQPDTSTRLALAAGPVVSAADPASGCSTGCEAVVGSGYLSSTGGATHSTRASVAGALRGTVAILPTATSPLGLVRVQLTDLSVTCGTTAGSTPPSFVDVSYSGLVSVRTYDAATNTYGYQDFPISSSASSDALAGITLSTWPVGPDPTDTDTTDGTTLLVLGDYLQSIDSLSSPTIASERILAADGRSAGFDVPGVFTVSSKPLRTEAASTFGLQIGAASCVAGDIR